MSSHRQIILPESFVKPISERGSVSNPSDETSVWQKFIDGDDESLVCIYRTYADVLFRYGSQFSSKSELVKDCIQELFFELIDKRARLSRAQSVKGYLFSCLKRKMIREMKKEEKLKFEEDGFSFQMEPITFMSSTIDVSDFSILKTKLNELPVAQREVIMLHFHEGLSYSEIAEVMSIKVKSARALTYRALDSLYKQLAPVKHLISVFVSLVWWLI